MLTIGIEYLTGYAVATDCVDRDSPEWPPHPARIFMALAAAYFETGEEAAEKAALEWLEGLQTQPNLIAADADKRTLVTHYVPVNDALNDTRAALPMLRRRQSRGYPRVRPLDPVMYLHWQDIEIQPSIFAALDSLCGKVARLGHSSSLVRMWATYDPPISRQVLQHWAHDENISDMRVRMVTPGSLDELRSRFRAAERNEYERLDQMRQNGSAKEKKQAKVDLVEKFNNLSPEPLRPNFRITTGYRLLKHDPTVSGSVWDERLLVIGIEAMELGHSRLDILSTLRVTKALRDAAMSIKADGIPESLSGHKPEGAPSESPHCAFFALPFIGSRHADGHVMGVSVAVPNAKHLSASDRREIASRLSRITELRLGALGKWRLLGGEELSDSRTLQPRTWCATPRGSSEWATVTPIVFDSHPKTNNRVAYLAEIAEMIMRSCERVDLPPPISVIPSHVSVHEGVPTAREFPRLQRKDGSERRHLHARIIFDRPVMGPILIGAGRYRGYGLLSPVWEKT